MFRKLSGLLLGLAIAACGTPDSGSSTTDTSSASGADGVVFDVAKDIQGDGSGGDSKDAGGDSAAGGLVLTFEVDDSANQTFGDGEIVWTGSFSWDQASNSIVYATSWLPSDGPYPPLYDDGPISGGGHEREGATKGDHIFSTQVKFAPTEDTTLEYGALNELGNWMWNGPNGTLVLKKGQSGVVAVPGMKIAKHGNIDLKISLDTAKLAACCTKWSLATHALYLKGSMNMWTPIQLLDDGQKGDDKAGDGIITYVHKQNLGKHDGGLNANDEAQFIFVSTQGDTLPDAGQEYKGAKEAFADGVAAWTATGPGGSWETAEVVLSKDSKGKFLNTAVKIPEPKGGTGCVPACTGSQTCENGVCKDPAPKTCEPACGANQICEGTTCVDKPVGLKLDSVDPSKGGLGGGTAVTLTGSGFLDPLTVTFGGIAATEVAISAGGTIITCKTPAHAVGSVDVEVALKDGAKASIKGGFVYEAPPKPSLLLVPSFLPADGKVGEAQPLALVASVSIAGVTSASGVTPDLDVWIGSAKAGSAVGKDSDWNWTKATYDGEGTGEAWAASLPGLAKGEWLLGAKLTWQNQTVYSEAVAVSAVDPKTLPSKLSSASPPFAAAKGGSVVSLLGVNLPADATVEFALPNGAKAGALAVKAVSTGLEVTVPALALGPVDVLVTPPGKTPLLLPAGLTIIPLASPKVDGDLADQPPQHLLASNQVATAWGVGKNQLSSLWVSYDAQNLTIGVAGQAEDTNAISVYLDIDYGSGTGVLSPVDLKDNSGAVDDALASALKLNDAKLGLDFGFASLGLASFDGLDLGKSTLAGWRGFADTGNFAWLLGAIAGKPGAGLEATIPLKVLYPNGIPAAGAAVRVLVVLGNKDGAAISNQFLPEQGASTVTAGLSVFPVN